MNEYLSDDDMREILIEYIDSNYKNMAAYCREFNLDGGNVSKALRGMGTITNSMIEPIGYSKENIAIYSRKVNYLD